MKILFLLTQDLESPSGLGRYWPMAHALHTRGHNVRIVALHSNWKALATRKFEREGVIVEYVAPMHVIKRDNQKQYYSSLQLIAVTLYATFALFRAAMLGHADIIHIGKPHPMNSIAGFLVSKIKKTTLCLDCDDYEARSNNIKKRWQQVIISFFEKNMPGKARLITTNTFFMKSMLLSWGCPTKRIYYLSNGIERERFLAPLSSEVDRLRNKLGLQGKRIVLYLGSLSLKNHPVDLLIKAFSLIAMKNTDIALLIVGSGEDYNKLVTQTKKLDIEKLAYFTGRVPPDDVPMYYYLADVSVDPIYDDDAARGRSPLKLFESWACNVPFVSSPVGDRSVLIGTSHAGLLCRPGDPNELGKAIIKVLANKELSEELRNNGRERVKDYYWDRLIEDLEVAYNQSTSLQAAI